MAKVPFSKLQASMNNNTYEVGYCNKAGEEIKYEVKSYLPFKEKLEMITRIINQSIDDNGFYNPMRVKMYMVLETVYAYTNLSFTEKMKEDVFKLYDILVSTGIANNVIDCIRNDEWPEIQDAVWNTIKNIYDYRNSAAGIIEMVSSDMNLVNMDLNEIQSKLADPNALSLVKEILPLTNATVV